MNAAARSSRLADAVHAVCTPLALAAIRFYKRRLSPHKGFSCAYRVHVGACSCSTLGLRAISRYGAWRGIGVLQLRLGQCRLAAEALRESRRRGITAHAQAGFVDCDVPCDASCADGCSLGEACEFVGCLDSIGDADCGGCGGPSGRRAKPRPPLQRGRRRRGDPPAGPVAAPPPVDVSD